MYRGIVSLPKCDSTSPILGVLSACSRLSFICNAEWEWRMGTENGNGMRAESIRDVILYTHLMKDGSGVHLECIGDYIQLPSVSHSHHYVPDPT